MENNLENTPGIETTHPIRSSETGWVVSIAGVFSKLFSTSFWTSYWASCFNSRCILQVVFHLFLNFLLGELFQFQVYSPTCFQPASELLIWWVVSIPGVFSSCFQPVSERLIGWFVSIPGVFSKLFSTSFWTSCWVSCFNSRCILQVIFNLFLNFLLGELFQFQVYSPSCFPPLTELLIGWVFQFQVFSSSCFQPVSELLIVWIVSIPGVFSKLFSTSYWTSYWVSCFNSRCILQVVFNLFLNFLLGELFQFQVYSPSCFPPVSELLIGWKQLGEYTWNWNNSPNKNFRKRLKTTWRIHRELKHLTQ